MATYQPTDYRDFAVNAPGSLLGLSPTGLAPVAGQIKAYQDQQQRFQDAVNTMADQYGVKSYWQRPEFQSLYADTRKQYDDLRSSLGGLKLDRSAFADPAGFNPVRGTTYAALDNTQLDTLLGKGLNINAPAYPKGQEKGMGGFGDFLKIAAPIALNFVPGVGTAIGTALGATGATAGALGGAVLGAGTGLATGGGLKGALLGGVTGGAGGYLNAGGWTDLKDGLGISGDLFGSSSDLPWLTNTTSLSPTAGGYQFGDFAAGKDVLGSGTFADSLAQSAQTASTAAVDPWASGLASTATPSTAGGTMGTFWDKALSGLSDSLDPGKMAGSALKGGLGLALSKSPDGGYRALQAAADQNKALYAPFLESGRTANATLAGALGLSGDAGYDSALAGFRQGPGYQFALKQGVAARDASAARRGMLISGNQDEELTEFGQGLADQDWDQYLSRLAAQAGVGYQAAGDTGTANMYGASAEAMRKKARADQWNGVLAQALYPRTFFA